MANFVVKQAKRQLIWVKVALMGPSGSGKTYGALTIATGMKNKMKELGTDTKILLANTEDSRGYYYADEFEYDIVDMEQPHNPENYVELIEYAVNNGYKILVIDTASHEWKRCLELHQQAGGTYQAWGKVTPRHDKFISTLAGSPLHIIATMRGKDAYEIEKSDQGKTTVKKLGVGSVAREGTEYEFTLTFSIDQKTNLATPQKDNTHIFDHDGSDVLLTENHGEQIINWANSGEGFNVEVKYSSKKAETETIDNKKKIIELCKSLGGSDNEKLMSLLKEYHPTGNPNKITDEEKQKELVEKLAEMSKEKEQE